MKEMLECADILGDWKEGLLVDSGENVSIDPELNFFDDGKLKGQFAGDDNPFEVTTCEVIGSGSKLKLEFTRVDNDGKMTIYKGKVVSFEPRANVGIIKGTFERDEIREGRKERVNGDWETEKPT